MPLNTMLRLGFHSFRWDVVQNEQGFDGDCGEGVPASMNITKFDQAR